MTLLNVIWSLVAFLVLYEVYTFFAEEKWRELFPGYSLWEDLFGSKKK
jgi:hypothetical protein